MSADNAATLPSAAEVSALRSRLEETEFRLQNLIYRQTALELSTNSRQSVRVDAPDGEEARAQCVEQLARAYIHLRNVYMSNLKTETACFDSRKIGEWLASLRDAVPESVYQAVLERGNELDMKNYGTKVGDWRRLILQRKTLTTLQYQTNEVRDGVTSLR